MKLSTHMRNKLAHTCPICKKTQRQCINLPYKTFRHFDCAEFKLTSGNIICECSNCGALFRSFNVSGEDVNNDTLDIANIYKSENYAKHKMVHMVYEKDNGVMSPLSEAQAKIIAGSLPTQLNLKGILDIGCFDGKLLVSLKKRLNAERYLGFDVDKREGFPYNSGIEFTQKPVDEITGTYDLILLSQSIMYIPDLENLFNNISRLLSEQGVVFIQVPDLSLKPCSVLLGDQHHYFSRRSIKSMLQHFNFECSFYADTPFPKDILLLAKVKDVNSEKFDNNQNPKKTLLQAISEYLGSLVENIERISGKSNEFAILGTTIEAGFVYHLIPDRVLCFVDENPLKIGSSFQGKPVIHPSELSEESNCIVPMGKQAKGLLDRLKQEFHGNYYLV